jgi:hypothetical protein
VNVHQTLKWMHWYKLTLTFTTYPFKVSWLMTLIQSMQNNKPKIFSRSWSFQSTTQNEMVQDHVLTNMSDFILTVDLDPCITRNLNPLWLFHQWPPPPPAHPPTGKCTYGKYQFRLLHASKLSLSYIKADISIVNMFRTLPIVEMTLLLITSSHIWWF